MHYILTDLPEIDIRRENKPELFSNKLISQS